MKFEDCLTCRHMLSDLCDDCNFGEHFEFDTDANLEQPNDSELIAMVRDVDEV
jgi:hypothetical protein